MKILGISGKARHGKDVCTSIALDILAEEYNRLAVGRFALADILKAKVYGEAKGEYTLTDVWVNKPPAIRHLLQQAGTELGRNVFGEDYWLLQAEALFGIFQSFLDIVIVPDIRFPNEVQFIKNGGRAPTSKESSTLTPGMSLYISSDRPTLEGKDAQHASETALDNYPKSNFDGVIINNMDTTFDMLREQLRPFLRKLVLG